MKVEIPKHFEGDGGWSHGGKHWKVSTLLEAAKGLEEFELPLAGIDMSGKPWNMSGFIWILYHIQRVQKANLKYPIILCPEGQIIDGWHRIAKAVLQGKETIKAVKLRVMPEVDIFENNDE